MRETDIIRCLRENDYISYEALAQKLNLSQNTIRRTIQLINQDKENGCYIRNVKHEGLKVFIEDNEKFEKYFQASIREIDYFSQPQRTHIILFYLMQSSTYVTLQELSDYTGLSRSTLLTDLKQVSQELESNHLTLENRRHYGIRIKGNEKDYRKAFSKYVIESELYVEPVRDYLDFISKFDDRLLQEKLRAIIRKYNLEISELAFQNIMIHLQIVMYRSYQQNFIQKLEKKIDIDPLYLSISEEIKKIVYEQICIELPEDEIKLFALEIQSKTSVLNQHEKTREIYEIKIKEILKQLDEEFNGDFQNDDELIGNLLLHIYPLIDRIGYNFQLKNPLIDDIYLKYNNVFTVAIRFADLISQGMDNFELTKDEIGFITLHFATHFEKIKKKQLEDVKRIAVICVTGKSTSLLIKLKLESIFMNASIVVISMNDIEAAEKEKPDLILSTVPIGEEYHGIPIIQIKEFLSDDEITEIKNKTLLKLRQQKSESRTLLNVLALFNKELFQIIESGDYFEIIKQQAEYMHQIGKANSDYPKLVLQREKKYPTIFMNGVASPHPIRLEANESCVGVTILKKPLRCFDKEVQMIFLINLRADCLFLHQELQRLLLKIIENDDLRRRLLNCDSYEAFIYELKKLI